MSKRTVKSIICVCAAAIIIAAVLVCILSKNDYKVFDAFFAYQGKSVAENNRVRTRLDDATGVRVEMRFLSSGTVEDEINLMVNQQTYPDFIDGSSSTALLINAGAFVPLEDLIGNYPNLYGYLSEGEWEQMKSADGHIYIIPQFGIVQGHETDTSHREEAFFIQKAVLEWANYPQIRTVEEYLELIGKYAAEFPVINGKSTIGFQILCDDWRGFCLSNPPQFLAGYPNDGCSIVNSDTYEAKLYDFTDEAYTYYKLLNSAYGSGLIHAETFVQTYEQYIELISSGCVLGMVDQYWQFETAQNALYEAGMTERTYVPLGLTINSGVKERYRSLEALDNSNGIGISVSCTDVEGALSFIDKLLSPEMMKLRYWGEEGTDYLVDENGEFFRTEQQRRDAGNSAYVNESFCSYNYFPHFDGMLADGKNTVKPAEQPSEFYLSQNDYDRGFLSAYGYESWVDFLNEPEEEVPAWFPLYTYTNNLTEESAEGRIHKALEKKRIEWLPQVIMADKDRFDKVWSEYKTSVYDTLDVDFYEEMLTNEVKRRCEGK